MKRKAILFLVLLAMVMGLTATVSAQPDDGDQAPSRVRFWLTVLHNNDGESQVINAGEGLEDFGGAAGFKTVVDDLRWWATHADGTERGAKRGVVMISSGDNFLAGPEFNVSLMNGVPFYDSIAMDLIGYDAVNLGNHDFDFGPDVLAAFIDGYENTPPYVSANMDFSDEPALQAYVDAGILRSTIMIKERGIKIGVIGLQTPSLPFISSPRNATVDPNLVGVVQAAANRMTDRGVEIIILTSHLQDITNELNLVPQLRNVDIVIAGGGDEMLANPDDLLVPGDVPVGTYPLWATDRTGRQVPVVTTTGSYKYVGKLVVGFDAAGNLIYTDADRSGPVRVATDDCNATLPCDDAVVPDATMLTEVVEPTQAGLAELAANIIAQSEVDLDGTRASVRAVESNEGNLIADALLWQAQKDAAAFGAEVPDVALQNSGGIRNDTVISAGDITSLTTFDIAPFPNFVSIVDAISRDHFKEVMENTVACTQPTDAGGNALCGTGRFAQIAGFSFEWSASGAPLILDINQNVIQAGSRVVSIVLDDGTVIVENGVVVPGDPIVITTNDFSARGGDQYPFRGTPFTNVGSTYQQALHNFIVDGLGGEITAADYPEGGEGRIVKLP